ncbi:hypothetical protein [Phenylobacterium aquaticum]|uniref:hypothetical protein n=1 Tax=Phenylobacterium aquaticum TaxID=1763816 RepID=UPI001F5DCC71|nr:hypothetical protein [Phenylobacterium aquaticum]MCI3135444.1 hypothetical protein [Phenylobacterium aquaticum]
MDIHKPKAAHSWSEFLIEIGTIVCGILIALAGEQIVESFHWRHEVEAEREALRDEARDNLSAVAYRQAETPCIDRRLAELEEGFRRQAQGAPLAFRQPFTRPPIWVASTGTWDIAVSGQALGHMSHKEKLAFSDAYDAYKAFARLRNDEDMVWRRLALINHREMLGPGDWVELHQAWGEAVGTNDRMKSLLTYIKGSAAMGQSPKPIAGADLADLKAFCTSLF